MMMREVAVYPRLVQDELQPVLEQAPRTPRRTLAFALFMLLNGALFIRPAEIFPPLEHLPVYELLIISCFALSLDGVLKQLHPRNLAQRPINLMVLGLLAAVGLSLGSHFQFASLADSGVAFAKIVVYYLLLMALVDSPRRLHLFMVWLAVLMGFLALLPLLQYYGFISLADLAPVHETTLNATTGEELSVHRLRGIGIFGDPNDLSHMLSAGLPLGLYALTDRRQGVRRWLWLIPLGLSLYTIVLTKSRGGFLALEAALGTVSLAALGWKRSMLVLGLMLPLMVAVYLQRQTADVTGDTQLQRIQIWSDAMEVFKRSPLFGLGANQFGGEDGLVAHNSFVQAFAELGLFGGVLFLGIFYVSVSTLARLAMHPESVLDQAMRRMLPYLTGAVAGYIGGMLSLTRNYLAPPYTIAGLAASYLAIAPIASPAMLPRAGGRLLKVMLRAAALSLLAMYVFVRLMVRWQ